MYWRISSFPELDHLSADERQLLLRRHAGRRWTVKIIAFAMMAGFVLSLAAMGILAAVQPVPLAPYLIGCTFLAGSVITYQVSMMIIRAQLRSVLADTARRERLPMCLKCGYNLKGIASTRCPECGYHLSTPPGTLPPEETP